MSDHSEAREGWTRTSIGWRHTASGCGVICEGRAGGWIAIDPSRQAHPACCDEDGSAIVYPSLGGAQEAVEAAGAISPPVEPTSSQPQLPDLHERKVDALERIADALEKLAIDGHRMVVAHAGAALWKEHVAGRWVRDDGWVVRWDSDGVHAYVVLRPDGTPFEGHGKRDEVVDWSSAEEAREDVDLHIAPLTDPSGVAVGWRWDPGSRWDDGS